MRKKVLWITETAVMLALLVALQWMTKPLGQLVTGTCVNCVLAVTVLVAGMSSGITVALISPVFAFLFGIAPNIVTVLPIMMGNVAFVALLRWIAGKGNRLTWRQPVALITAAGVKFGLLYLLVVQLICGSMASLLLGKKVGDAVVLAPKMLEVLPATFTWPQLFTALLGGALALLLAPTLRKALKK